MSSSSEFTKESPVESVVETTERVQLCVAAETEIDSAREVPAVVEYPNAPGNAEQAAADVVLFEYLHPDSVAENIRRKASGVGFDVVQVTFILFVALVASTVALFFYPLFLVHHEYCLSMIQSLTGWHFPEWVLQNHGWYALLIMYARFVCGPVFAVTALIAFLYCNRRPELTLLDRLRPNFVSSSKEGLSLVWRRKLPPLSVSRKCFDWKQLAAISTIRPSAAHDSELGVCFVLHNKKKITLRASCLSRFDQWQTIFSIAREQAPNVTISNNALEDLRPLCLRNSYTQIWLNAFQVGSRSRDNDLQPGTELQEGHYVIEKRLGSGGQGVSYLARTHSSFLNGGSVFNSSSETYEGLEEVVLKEYVLPTGVSPDVRSKMIATCIKEVSLLSRLCHDNVVKLLDVFVEDHRTYVVLEYVRGRSLRQMVQAEGPLPAELVRQFAEQMCTALAYLHSQAPPVVHQDFTPDNLIWSPAGSLKLLDFSMSRQSSSVRTTTVVGKQAYIAPEQFRGMPVPQSDLYSMGATLFYLLTGTDAEPLSQSRPSSIRNDIPPDLDDLVWQLTAYETDKRIDSAQAARGIISDLGGQEHDR